MLKIANFNLATCIWCHCWVWPNWNSA